MVSTLQTNLDLQYREKNKSGVEGSQPSRVIGLKLNVARLDPCINHKKWAPTRMLYNNQRKDLRVKCSGKYCHGDCSAHKSLDCWVTNCTERVKINLDNRKQQ